MTRRDEFEQTLTAWLRREAPPQAPDRVLDSALERVAAQSQRRSWQQRLMGETPMAAFIRIAAVAAVVAFAAFIAYQFSSLPPDVGASPSPSAEATTSQTELPGASASPSANPGVAALVLRLEGGAEDGRVHLITVLEDGRIISTSHQGTSHPTVERRLKAAGVQLLLDELDATGLTFLTSADYYPVSKPGIEAPGYGGAGPALEVGLPGGGTSVTTWLFFGDDGLYFEPQPEAEALGALYARLTTLDEWLPADAWADANARPYEPAQYRVFVISNPWGGSLDDLVEVSDVSWPVSASVRGLVDQIVATMEEPNSSQQCNVLSAADAALMQASMVNAGVPAADYFVPSYRLGDRDAARVTDLVFDPILPLDETGCDGGYSLYF